MRSWEELKYVSLLDLWSGVVNLFRRPKNEEEHCCQDHEDAMYRTAMLALKTGKPVVGEVSEDGKSLTTKILD